MQEPAHNRIETRVVYVIDFLLAQLIIATLPAYGVPSDQKGEDTKRSGTAPIHKGITKKEVFYDIVIPTTHAETDVKERPLPELRGEIVLFVGVGDEGVVGSHHCDVEMEEVPEEGRFV